MKINGKTVDFNEFYKNAHEYGLANTQESARVLYDYITSKEAKTGNEEEFASWFFWQDDWIIYFCEDQRRLFDEYDWLYPEAQAGAAGNADMDDQLRCETYFSDVMCAIRDNPDFDAIAVKIDCSDGSHKVVDIANDDWDYAMIRYNAKN